MYIYFVICSSVYLIFLIFKGRLSNTSFSYNVIKKKKKKKYVNLTLVYFN